jgi:hypothetical protein
MSYNASKSQLKEPEVAGVIDLQDLSMAEIHQKFSEIYDENNLLRISLQAEVNIREKLEKKNREISEKLVETRQGLQETRTALINLQAVTEDLIQRKEEREMQLQKVISISKTYERRIAELETNSVKSEEVAKLHSIISSTKMAVMEKEEAMQQLEQQILQLQQAVRSARSDVQVAVEDKKFVEVKLQHAGEKINQLDSTVEKQKEKMTDMQMATMSLESTISSLRDKMADMQMAKVNLETVKMSLESSNSKHKERISELTTANQELQNKIIAMTRTKLELEHKLEQSQKDYDNKSLTGQLSNGNNLGPAVDSGKDRSGLEERMMALEKMLTNLPMLSGNNSSTSTNTNSGKFSMNRTSSQQRLQQHQPSPSSSKNVPSTPNGGQPRSQPSLRKSMGQSMTSSNGTDEILYEDSNQESRGRFASDSSVGQISRSGSQQDFVPLNLPMGVRTKTQSMDDGSSLRGKLDSMDDYRSKTISMDDAGDPEVRQAVERTARAMIQSVIPQGGSSPSSSSILRKSLGASPSNYNSSSSNHNASVTTPGSRVSFSLDNNSVHVIPNKDKDKDNRNKEKEKEKEQREREREQREREKEKDREREQREREKEREREECEKEKQREKDRKDKEENDRRAREERDRRDREERERQKEEQKRREKEQQRAAEQEQREQREREQREQTEREQRERKQREKEQREREQKEKEQRDREQKDKEQERSFEIRSRKSMMKQASSKNFDASDPAAVQVRNMKTDINNMISQHRELKNQIKEFTEKFKAEHNGAEPGKVDRKNLAGDIFKNYDKLSKSIKKKMKELEVFQAENGGVGASTKIPGAGTPSTKLQSFDKSSKSSRSDADDGSLSSDDSDDS